MALKKLSITEEQAGKVKELLNKGLSTYKIAEILGLNQPKVWRNMKFMDVCKNKPIKEITKTKYFRWSDYNNSVI